MEINIANLSNEELDWLINRMKMRFEPTTKSNARIIDMKTDTVCGFIEGVRMVIHIKEVK